MSVEYTEKHYDTAQLESVDTNSEPSNADFTHDPAEEAVIIRKLDRVLLPFVFVLYSLAILDRSNLGNAKLAGLQQDVDLSGNKYGLLGTIFYVAC